MAVSGAGAPPACELPTCQIAHDVGEHERLEHGVEASSIQPKAAARSRAALLGRCLAQKLDWADGHWGGIVAGDWSAVRKQKKTVSEEMCCRLGFDA
jgi:hypothetical protein